MEAPAPLADYFVVVGLDEQEHPPADIWAKVRRDGHICELATVSARDEFPLPEDGWAVATKTPTGRSAIDRGESPQRGAPEIESASN